MKLFKILFLICFFFVSFENFSQTQQKTISFEEVIQQATTQSRQAFLAKHQFRASYWRYRSFQLGKLPQMSLSLTPINMNRSISPVTLPTGEEKYVERSYNQIYGGINLEQNLYTTGGTLLINSGLERLDLYGENESTTYLSTPVGITYLQPIFAYNQYKWDKRIEPLAYAQSSKQYLEAMETVKITATTYFYDLVLAQLNVEMAKTNFGNNDTLFRIATGRYNIGTIPQNDLLQMQLNFLNSEVELNKALLNLQIKAANLRSFLGYNENTDISVFFSQQIPDFKIEVAKAVELALKNNPTMLEQQTVMLTAQSEVEKAFREKSFNANISASVGLTQQAENISAAYQNPQDREIFRIGLEIPIIDWGEAKSKYYLAKSNLEMTELNVQQTKIDFEQQVEILVHEFNMQRQQLILAAKADTISQSRYNVTYQRFLIGRVDVLELNIARQEKDAARRSYISELLSFWTLYYTIRKLTLFDFELNTEISTDFEELL